MKTALGNTYLSKVENSVIFAMSALGDVHGDLLSSRNEEWDAGGDGHLETELMDEWKKAIDALNAILDRLAPPEVPDPTPEGPEPCYICDSLCFTTTTIEEQGQIVKVPYCGCLEAGQEDEHLPPWEHAVPEGVDPDEWGSVEYDHSLSDPNAHQDWSKLDAKES